MIRFAFAAVAMVFVMLPASPTAADDSKGYYGVVEAYGGGEIVIRTTANSVGHWKIDDKTVVRGEVRVSDWVGAQVELSGRVRFLSFQDRPAPRSGIIQAVDGSALTVRSGTGAEKWFLVATTGYHGVERGRLRAGDEIGALLYKSRNLAEVTLIKAVE